MNVTDVILNSTAIFDNAQKEITEYYRKTGSEVGPTLDYAIVDDNTIDANYGYWDYEEGEDIQVKIHVTSDEIKVERNNSGSSVMCEFPFNDDSTLIFSNETDFLTWLKEDIG